MDKVTCPKCKGKPERQYCNNGVFNTYICYPRCGYIFWTIKTCPLCQEPNSTTLLKKPNFGQKVRCNMCKKEMYFFLCSKSDCEKIFFKVAENYTMGDVVTCEYEECQYSFKNLSCPCGNEFKRKKQELIYQGVSAFDCNCCNQKLIYTVCPRCKEPEYHIDQLNVGDRIRCSSCKEWRKYVPCPFCGKCLKGQSFSFYEPIHCNFCQKWFQFCKCAYNCPSVSYNQLEKVMGPERKCYECKRNYAVINCQKCKESLFRQDLKPSSEGFIEMCPICKGQLEYFYCNKCGTFNNGMLECKGCKAKPQKVNDTIKEQEMMKKAKEIKEYEPTEEEKSCKLCFSQ